MRFNLSSRLSKLLPLAVALVILLPLLAACAANSPTAIPTQTAGPGPVLELDTATPEATLTPYPSQTPLPTRTPTIAPTLPPTEAPAPTLDPAFSDVKLAGLAWLQNYNLLLSFNFPNPINPEDYRVTLEDKEYKCEVLPQYPNRLYCHGQGARVLGVAMVKVYPAGSDQVGFEKEVWVPYFNNQY